MRWGLGAAGGVAMSRALRVAPAGGVASQSAVAVGGGKVVEEVVEEAGEETREAGSSGSETTEEGTDPATAVKTSLVTTGLNRRAVVGIESASNLALPDCM